MNVNFQKIGLILLCFALIQILFNTGYALAQGGLPPRPGGVGSGGGSGGGSGDGDGDGDGPSIILGDIYGQVIDQSTGQPGRGLIVMINDIPIKTDASGRFSLTGIADGAYLVDLNLPPEFTPAQPVKTVLIANRERVDIELGYYSLTPPAPVDSSTSFVAESASSAITAQPQTGATDSESASLEDFPQTVPETGGLAYPKGFVFYLLGILVWTFGMVQILQKAAP